MMMPEHQQQHAHRQRDTVICAADDDGEDALGREVAHIPQHCRLKLVERVDEHE